MLFGLERARVDGDGSPRPRACLRLSFAYPLSGWHSRSRANVLGSRASLPLRSSWPNRPLNNCHTFSCRALFFPGRSGAQRQKFVRAVRVVRSVFKHFTLAEWMKEPSHVQ